MPSLNELAVQAGKIAEEVYQRGHNEQTKNDGTIVTNADLMVRDYLMRATQAGWPGSAYLGEEGQAGPIDARELIVVDEIDGTGDFARGGQDCSIVIARAVRNDNGVVTFKEVVINHFRSNCYFNAHILGGVLGVSDGVTICYTEVTPHIDRAPVVAIANWPPARHNLEQGRAALEEQGFATIDPGGIAAMAGKLITGDIDCILFPGATNTPDGVVKNSWHECGPMQFMLESVGVICTDLAGDPLVFDEVTLKNGYPGRQLRRGFAASWNQGLHDRLIKVIAPFIED